MNRLTEYLNALINYFSSSAKRGMTTPGAPIAAKSAVSSPSIIAYDIKLDKIYNIVMRTTTEKINK